MAPTRPQEKKSTQRNHGVGQELSARDRGSRSFAEVKKEKFIPSLIGRPKVVLKKIQICSMLSRNGSVMLIWIPLNLILGNSLLRRLCPYPSPTVQ